MCPQDMVQNSSNKSEWGDSTQNCLLKVSEIMVSYLQSNHQWPLTVGYVSCYFILQVYGIKTLVKSYLPCKDAHAQPGIEKLIDILKNILTYGDISPNMVSRYQ
jgi:sister-chromatid-cohesion protein PDS5